MYGDTTLLDVGINPSTDDGGDLLYRWDRRTDTLTAGQATPAGYSYSCINLGWRTNPLNGPDVLVDDVRICSAAGATECGWE